MPKEIKVARVGTIVGDIRVPSDKSLTHRSYMLASIASEPSVVRYLLRGEDCENTRNCLIAMGLRHEVIAPDTFRLIPAHEWNSPVGELDCGNSGTTVRLMSGLIASRSISATLVGDASLSRRPMKRIAEPLRLMGASIQGDELPLNIEGGQLKSIAYHSMVASAQVKSCILLAGLRASGTTSVTEPSLSRDHTERMLEATGVELKRDGLTVSVEGGQQPKGFDFEVPADISSAAFMMVAAALVPNSRLTCRAVGVNPSRTGILDVLKEVGVPFELTNEKNELNEPSADIEIYAPKQLKPFVIEGFLVPRLIDEIPVLAVLAT
ncbi:MAG TPA: 3-phosphoshikimate 1-carboxyvinyltransferase, partial [Fimbriimonas sp.]|nr:3-phosphoshikimate 1-carboxyvinyltransferase [Fimbriimonas sp.]